MTKRVHFATTNMLYSPIPPTPSPTVSTASLPSSLAPPTPPSVHLTPMRHHPRSPFELKPDPLPDIHPREMQIHFLLAFTPYDDPSVNYDVSLPPSILDTQVPAQAYSEPATQPPLPHLDIICPYLEWKITVTPPSSQPGAFVTVLDVFNSLYRELRLPVHPTEYENLTSADITHGVNMAYYRRCGRIDDSEARQYEESKGVKRVDFLTGKNRFLGLSGTLKGPNIWELNVS